MSHTINAITYQFEPDRNTQALCEQVSSEINGNGASPSDISAESTTSTKVTVTSHFIWSVQVSLKSKTVAGKQTKNTKTHDSVLSAQTAAKKQGQHILKNSLGKIELINNINEDPGHFYKHSSVKLNGGNVHTLLLKCTQQCNSGQLTCPRCKGKGTHKATTKKEDFLGTSSDFSTKNNCPQCKGRGSIECHTCAGSGVTTQIYQVHVNATRADKDTVESSDKSVKTVIEKFISRQSHDELLKNYLSPTVIQLEDIDENHCKVVYQSKTGAILLKLLIKNFSHTVLGFGDKNKCINKSHILDDILLPEVDQIIGKNPKFSSIAKYQRLLSVPVLSQLLSAESSKFSPEQLNTVLQKHSHRLLSADASHQIIEKINRFKTALTPRYNLTSWATLTFLGVISALYISLEIRPLTDSVTIFSIHSLFVLAPAFYLSRGLTRRKREKLKQNNSLPTLEKLPALISIVLLLSATLIPKALTTENRWSVFYKTHQTYQSVFSQKLSNNFVISNPKEIQLAQKYLTILGYKNITENGDFDLATAGAVKDFQNKFGIDDAKYLDMQTMGLLIRYSVFKTASFNDPETVSDGAASR